MAWGLAHTCHWQWQHQRSHQGRPPQTQAPVCLASDTPRGLARPPALVQLSCQQAGPGAPLHKEMLMMPQLCSMLRAPTLSYSAPVLTQLAAHDVGTSLHRLFHVLSRPWEVRTLGSCCLFVAELAADGDTRGSTYIRTTCRPHTCLQSHMTKTKQVMTTYLPYPSSACLGNRQNQSRASKRSRRGCSAAASAHCSRAAEGRSSLR